MAAQYILALDQGTSSSRAILFTREGRPLASAQHELPQILPKPGIVEHDPEAIWSTQLAAARDAIAQAKVQPQQIAAIAVTNQRETTILWDRKTGKAVHPAIVWQSRVSAEICDRLKQEGMESTFHRKTGLLIDPYFSATKIDYLLDTIPGLRAHAAHGDILFGTVDSYLIWRLTGGRHVTDVSNASRTMLYNIHALAWDDELLKILEIPHRMLPEVRSSSEVYGQTLPEWFGAPIPVASACGDQQAATFGQACFEPGSAKNTYGTGCFLLLNTGEKPVESHNRLLTTIGWQLGGRTTYCLEGSVFVAGAVVQWLRDGLGLISNSAEVEQLAAQAEDSGGVYLVPAFVGLGAPYWDAYARGGVLGITRGTTAAQIARAAVDSMAYQSRDLLEAMQSDTGQQLTALKVDGGAAANDALMQFQADMLGVPVERPAVLETTALGAAYLAGLAVGYWSDTAELARHAVIEKRFEPQMAKPERERLYRGWKKAVERCLGWEGRE